MKRLGNIYSWAGLLALLLALVSVWVFLFRSDLPPGGEALLPAACPDNKVERIQASQSTVIHRARGCGRVPESMAEQVSRESARAGEQIKELGLPDPRGTPAIEILEAGNPGWRSWSSPGSPGAGRISPGSEAEVAFRTGAVMVALSLAEAAPSLPARQRDLLAGAMLLQSERFSDAGLFLFVPAGIKALADQIKLKEIPKKLCRRGSCRIGNLRARPGSKRSSSSVDHGKQ